MAKWTVIPEGDGRTCAQIPHVCRVINPCDAFVTSCCSSPDERERRGKKMIY